MGAYLKSDTNRLNSSSHIFNVFAWGEKTSLMVDGATYAAKKHGPDPLMPAIAPDGHSRDPLHEVHPPKSISYARGAASNNRHVQIRTPFSPRQGAFCSHGLWYNVAWNGCGGGRRGRGIIINRTRLPSKVGRFY